MKEEKSFYLDDNTAPKSPYIQIYEDSSGVRMLTLLNQYTNSIYFYNYETASYIKNIVYDKEGPHGILQIEGYYIKNEDSIYLYNRPLIEIALTDSKSHVNNRYILRSEVPNWPLYYPQYMLNTICPFIEINGKLILTGINPYSISDSLINKFKFTASIDIKNGQIEYHYTYPKDLYGSNANWDDPLYMQAYPELSHTGEIIHSFPMSHNIYLTKWGSESSRKVYAGSNVAKTIHSIDAVPHRMSEKTIVTHYLQQDLYKAIRYDPYRKVYYRFMLQGIPDASLGTSVEKKPVVIIIMDEQFNYLGESIIGTGEEWNWKNAFVTHEGLNIEYIEDITKDLNETYLNLKIFKIEKL
jgi:hypothetical protein